MFKTKVRYSSKQEKSRINANACYLTKPNIVLSFVTVIKSLNNVPKTNVVLGVIHVRYNVCLSYLRNINSVPSKKIILVQNNKF